jgi:thiamine biosynthesis lipoprotein
VLPDSAVLTEARARIGYEKLQLDSSKHCAKLTTSGMKLDLGGIAKGYAVDAALKVIASHGISRALVAAVGDIGVSGPPPGRDHWRIEIVALDATNAPAAKYVSLRHAAISTSGDLSQRLEIDGKRYSHIVDPHTGIGLTDHSIVSVIAPNCTDSDALATAVSVLGPTKGIELIRKYSGTEVRIVREPTAAVEIFESPGFAKYYTSPSR